MLSIEIASLGITHHEGVGVLVLSLDEVVGLIEGSIDASLDGRQLCDVMERVSTMGVLEGDFPLADQLQTAAARFDEPVDEMATDLLESVGHEQLLDNPTWYLSAGETTLARLAVALARPFELLLLVEPFAGLDARARAGAWALLEGGSHRAPGHRHCLVNWTEGLVD